MKRLITLLLLGLPLSASVQAEDAVTSTVNPVEPPDYTDWYQVEIIVFARRNPDITDEVWPGTEANYPDNMLTLAGADHSQLKPGSLSQLKDLLAYEAMMDGKVSTSAGPTGDEFLFEGRSRVARNRIVDRLSNHDDDSMPGDQDPIAPVDLEHLLHPEFPRAFEVVVDEQRFLNRIAGSVNRSSRYRLLRHTGWLQPLTPGGETWPVLIQAGDRYDDRHEVDGTIIISRSRYLHVNTNLWFTQFTQKYDQELPLPEIVGEFDPQTLREYPELVEVERNRGNYIAIHSHQMDISRRMRSATLHYLDHPYFGVLIQIEDFTYETGEDTEATLQSP